MQYTPPDPIDSYPQEASNRLPTLPSAPNAKATTIKLEDEQKEAARILKFTYARIIFLIALFILVLTSTTNTAIAILLTGILGLLSSSVFESIFSTIIEFFDGLFEKFAKAPPKLGNWLLAHNTLIINTFISALIVTLLFTIFSNAISNFTSNFNDSLCLRSSIPWPVCNSGIGLQSLPDGIKVGLITNSDAGPFDQTSLQSEEVQVESHIFHENSTACSSNHMTLAVVTVLSRTVEDPSSSATNGLEDLRGAFLAQHHYNSAHPVVSLCLVIANLGTLDNANKDSNLVKNSPATYSLPIVIKQLVQFAHHDKTFHGIVGFPYSTQAYNAISEFQNWSFTTIPIISPSASGDQLSDIPGFYRMVSPDQSQSQIMAQFFCSYLVPAQGNVTIDIFTYDADIYGQSLHFGFEDHLKQCPNYNKINVIHDPYKNGDATSIERAANDALQNNASYVFFPGYNTDLDTLETQLRGSAGNPSRITILGADGLYDSIGVTHYSFSPIYSTIFTSPLTTDPGLTTTASRPVIQEFINEYTDQHFPLPYLAKSIPDYTLFPPHAILAYDATTAFCKALEALRSSQFSQSQLNDQLRSISFMGVNAYIALQGGNNSSRHSSDPNAGNVYITCTDRFHAIHLIGKYESVNTDVPDIRQVLPVHGSPQNLCT